MEGSRGRVQPIGVLEVGSHKFVDVDVCADLILLMRMQMRIEYSNVDASGDIII